MSFHQSKTSQNPYRCFSHAPLQCSSWAVRNLTTCSRGEGHHLNRLALAFSVCLAREKKKRQAFSPPAMTFPSFEYAHAVTFVRVPRSFDFTTITVFCFLLFSTSHTLSKKRQPLFEKLDAKNYPPNRRVSGARNENLGIFWMPCTRRQVRNVSAESGPY